MPWSLHWKNQTSLTVWGNPLRPDRLAGLSRPELEQISLRVGSDREPLPALFSISGAPDGDTLRIEGDMATVRELGRGMEQGGLIVEGQVGPYAGAELRGGSLQITGTAGPGAGVAMEAGVLRINGFAGDCAGGPWPGETVGMRGGILVLNGGAGAALAHRMRRGVMLITGQVGPGLGWGMIAGTVVLSNRWPEDVGIGMKRGTIIATSPQPAPSLTPGFILAGRQWPGFLPLFTRALQNAGISCEELARHAGSSFHRYNGDRSVAGQGELLIRAQT